MTRAQGLLIVIGDPNVLQKDKHWHQMLVHLRKLNVVIGEPFRMENVRKGLDVKIPTICRRRRLRRRRQRQIKNLQTHPQMSWFR